jgi:hypothetical protein
MAADSLRARLYEHLKTRGRPATADELLRSALGIRSPNAVIAERVMRSIIEKDPRFSCRKGMWSAASHREIPLLAGEDRAVLCLQSSGGGSRPSALRGALLVLRQARSAEFLFSTTAGGGSEGRLAEARRAAEACLLVTWRSRERRLWNDWLRRCGLPAWRGEELLLSELVRRVFPAAAADPEPEDLASWLGVPPPDADGPASVARFRAGLLESLLDRVPEEHRGDLKSVDRWIEAGKPGVDFSRFGFSRELLASVPELPGVYIMRNRAGDIIYVGKSRNLRRRVRSYFTSRALRDPKIARIHEQLYGLEFTVADSEVEALVLETKLIRDFRPPVNLQTEVHEKHARYGRELNLVVLVPDVRDLAKAKAYFVRNSTFAGRVPVRLGHAVGSRLKSRIRSLYFARPNRGVRRAEDWEVELVSRWLRLRSRSLNAVDVDQAGTYEAVIGQLHSCLHDPEARTARVFYR